MADDETTEPTGDNEGSSRLTPRQERFCQEYIVDLNGTQAAIRAGYSEKSAQQISTENLSKPLVVSRVRELEALRAERTQITQDWVLAMLKRNAERSMQAEPAFNKDGEIIEFRFDGKAANGALGLLGKHLNMFGERVTNINIDLDSLTDEQLERVANGEPIEQVLATTSPRKAGPPETPAPDSDAP